MVLVLGGLLVIVCCRQKKFATARIFVCCWGRGQLRHDVLFIGQRTNQIRARCKFFVSQPLYFELYHGQNIVSIIIKWPCFQEQSITVQQGATLTRSFGVHFVRSMFYKLATHKHRVPQSQFNRLRNCGMSMNFPLLLGSVMGASQSYSKWFRQCTIK